MRITELSQAFALATKCAENPNIDDRERKYFRAIAHLIWKSCGDEGSFGHNGARTAQTALVEAADKIQTA